MRNVSLPVRAAVLGAACALVGACGLDRTLRHDLCNKDSDCNPEHVCLGGICSPRQDGGGANEAGEGSETRDAREAGNGYDASDVREAGDGLGDPCTSTLDDGPRANVSDTPGALLGPWRLCDAAPGPQVSWLVGAAGTIQVDAVTWARGAATSVTGGYFQILEGTKGLIHFCDPDVVDGSGADFSATISTKSNVLELSPCDGPETCSDVVSRFVPAGPAAPTGK